MSILILMVPMAILISLLFALAFVWAVKQEQFDDLDTPSHRILFDEFNQPVTGAQIQNKTKKDSHWKGKLQLP